ncbi:TauD/TfdA family dioxygenase [Lentzea kentuckyensis]|uniref:TauD/TfdA family dioxygenase n=1 Tax=Lentzea kentuckyensis TaxID=360086 RepID=UPI001302408D|nr:TauD/TfdA family dioxygenase [Lentzea kentuckyensis]
MLPYLLTPDDTTDLAERLRRDHDALLAKLHEAGALLFRGFDVNDPSGFRDVARSYTPDLLDYTYRSTPRKQAETGVYTSTEYPPDEQIPMHNENSYSRTWPAKLWFYCQQAAAAGGATPLADSRKVYRRVDPEIRDQFARRGVRYVRNYGAGMDLPWQEVFQTEDRANVEKFCREADIDFRWDGDLLRTSQVCPAVATHPATGEHVWFNQAHLFHPSALDEETREALTLLFGQDGLPRNAFFGDGGDIPVEHLDEVRAAYDAEMVDVAWCDGDVLLVDNLLAAHGRRSYTPPRKVLVAMAEATTS